MRDSDATVIISVGERLTGGSHYTLECANSQCRPLLHLFRRADEQGLESSSSERLASRLRAFLTEHRVRALNVAGPRATDEAGIGPLVAAVLSAALGSREVVRSALLPRAVAALVPLWGLQPVAPQLGVISLVAGRNVLGRLEGKLPPHMANYVPLLKDDPFVSNYHASIVVVETFRLVARRGAAPLVTIECTGSNGMEMVKRSSSDAVALRRGEPRTPQTVEEGDTLCLLPGGSHPYRLLIISAASAVAPRPPSDAPQEQEERKLERKRLRDA